MALTEKISRYVIAALLGSLCLLLAACGESEPESLPAATRVLPSPSPQETQTASVKVPMPTVAITATATAPAVSPTREPTPSPAAAPAPTPTPMPQPTPTSARALSPPAGASPVPVEISALNFAGVRVLLNEPSQVQAIFSLRDQNGDPVIVPAAELQGATRVFERGEGATAWEEIDYTETNVFVHSAERFALEVVFVLDFTRSMTSWQLPDGTTGSALMRRALENALDRLPAAHRVGVVAFHDRSAEPVIIAFPTTDRALVRAEVGRFAASGFDPGSSRLWDAVVRGLDMFPGERDAPSYVSRAVVFLSDGRDTSSLRKRADVSQQAQERGVQLYPLGLGDVYQESELRALATATNGAYFAVAELAQLEAQFEALVNDFAGQYKLSYTTLRREGAYAVRIETTVNGVTGVYSSESLAFSDVYSSDTQGRIAVDPPTIDGEAQTATTFVRALHVPRNVRRFRFTLPMDRPAAVSVVPARQGGLLAGWNLSPPDEAGYWTAAGQTPLPFGSFGLLFQVVVREASSADISIPIVFDNSGYSGNKRFVVVSGGVERPARLAFASLRDENWEIYVMDEQGALGDGQAAANGLTRLTDNPANDVAPHWSPDGRRIAFSSNRAGNFDIYVMNADGSELNQLTDDPGDEFSPRWSPDGRKFAFHSERENNVDVYVMNADGSGQTRLTTDRGRDLSPSWSPDGLRIAYISDRERNFDIYVMNADGSAHTKITSDRAADTAPAWSPDGRRLAFTSKRDGNWEVYTINADGTELTRLTNHPADDFAPAWSADGERLAFYSIRHLNYELYVLDLADGTVTRLTEHPALDADPAWAP